MSLSERLQRARTQQLIEAGLLPSERALKPVDDDLPASEGNAPTEAPATDGGLFEPIKLEVPPVGLHLVAEAPDLRQYRDATPESQRCPNCNGAARLDMVDLVGHTMHYTCENCGAMWQTRRPAADPIT